MNHDWCGCCRQQVLDNTESVRQLLIAKGIRFEDLWLFNEFYLPDEKVGFHPGKPMYITMIEEGGFFGVSDIVFHIDELLQTLRNVL